jgi:hypothetical protein
LENKGKKYIATNDRCIKISNSGDVLNSKNKTTQGYRFTYKLSDAGVLP